MREALGVAARGERRGAPGPRWVAWVGFADLVSSTLRGGERPSRGGRRRPAGPGWGPALGCAYGTERRLTADP